MVLQLLTSLWSPPPMPTHSTIFQPLHSAAAYSFPNPHYDSQSQHMWQGGVDVMLSHPGLSHPSFSSIPPSLTRHRVA